MPSPSGGPRDGAGGRRGRGHGAGRDLTATTAPPREGAVRLADGRDIGWAEWGDPDGFPVLQCHGSPSSRYERPFPNPDDPRYAGLRFLVVERPGFGRSDPAPDRVVTDFPRDLEQVLAARGIDRFAVLGLSGGTPYVCATVVAMPDRVTAAAVASGVPPPDVPFRWPALPAGARHLLHSAGPVSRALQRSLLEAFSRRPELLLPYVSVRLAPPDRALIRRTDIRDVLTGMFTEGLRQGAGPVAYDRALLLLRPWGFALRDVRMPVDLWHGGADWLSPLPAGRLLAAALPSARLHVVPEAGHLLLFTHAEKILRALVPHR